MAARLRGAPASRGRVPYRAEKESAVQRVQMRQQRGDLGQKRIAQDGRDLFVAAAAGVAHQLANFHAQGEGEPLQRTQGRNRLAVFDFRNVGARYLHPSRQLALAEVTRAAHLPHLCCHLRPGVGAVGHRIACHQLWG